MKRRRRPFEGDLVVGGLQFDDTSGSDGFGYHWEHWVEVNDQLWFGVILYRMADEYVLRADVDKHLLGEGQLEVCGVEWPLNPGEIDEYLRNPRLVRNRIHPELIARLREHSKLPPELEGRL